MDNTGSVHVLAENLMRIFPNLGKLMAVHLRESGEEETTLMQVSVLHQIRQHSITASELAKRRRVSLQSASVLIQGMVERGWIVRRPNPTDRRQFLLEITAEGSAKAEAILKQAVNFLATFLEDLSAEEIAAAEIFVPALSRVLTQDMASNNLEDGKERTLEGEETPL
jgi:DNA-binding MarR family transcriptional regulator